MRGGETIKKKGPGEGFERGDRRSEAGRQAAEGRKSDGMLWEEGGEISAVYGWCNDEESEKWEEGSRGIKQRKGRKGV